MLTNVEFLQVSCSCGFTSFCARQGRGEHHLKKTSVSLSWTAATTWIKLKMAGMKSLNCLCLEATCITSIFPSLLHFQLKTCAHCKPALISSFVIGFLLSKGRGLVSGMHDGLHVLFLSDFVWCLLTATYWGSAAAADYQYSQERVCLYREPRSALLKLWVGCSTFLLVFSPCSCSHQAEATCCWACSHACVSACVRVISNYTESVQEGESTWMLIVIKWRGVGGGLESPLRLQAKAYFTSDLKRQ